MLAATVLLAAAGLAGPLELVAERLETAPVIDGLVTEPEWQDAEATQQFTQKFPREGDAPSEQTTLRILYDDEAIYVAFDCTQQHSPIVSRATRRDGPALSDAVTFNLGSQGDRQSSFEFGVNVAGSLRDGLRFNDTQYSPEWDEIWQAATARTEKGWSAEFRIPLRILRFRAAAEHTWDFQASRYVAARQEIIEWQLIPRLSGGVVSRYGKLRGLTDLGSESHWELRPFLVGRLRHVGATSNRSRLLANASAGADLKYHPSQGLTLDATFNPDFAQVEADQELLNLGNVEAYLPEKRPFFLEGSAVFATPLQLLYTRRVGRLPEPPPALGIPEFGDELAEQPDPSLIYGASKLTGKLGDDWTIGLLQALTAPNRLTLRQGAGRARRVVEPLSAFGVARIKRELARGSYVGATLTTVQRLESGHGFAPLPAANVAARATEKYCPSGELVLAQAKCFNDAYVSSVDFRWSSEQEDWVAVGQLTQSLLQGGPPRRIPDGSVVEPGQVGLGAFGQLIKQSGQFIGELNFEYADQNLDYSDLGFSERSNLLGWSGNLEYRLPRGGALLESNLRFEYLAARNLAALDLGSSYYLGAYGKFHNLWQYSLYLHYVQGRFDDRELGNGVALERAPAVGIDLSLTTDTSQPVSFSFTTTSEWIETGANFIGSADLALRPLPELSLEAQPAVSYTLGEPRYATEGPQSGQYIFGNLAAGSASLTFRASYSFLPRLTLQTYGQLFFAAGDYSSLYAFQSLESQRLPSVRLSDLTPFELGLADNPDFQGAAFNLNLVLHWEYTPGSTLYAVYRRSQELEENAPAGRDARIAWDTLDRAPALQTFLLKLAIWWGN